MKCFQPSIIALIVTSSTCLIIIIALYGYLAYYVKKNYSQDLDEQRDQELLRIENRMRAYDGLPPLPGSPKSKHFAFDHMAYGQRYPELKALGTSESALKKHWITTGINKGYNGTSNDKCGRFDPIKYGQLHKDLSGLNSKQLIKHYLEKGLNEGRIIC